MPTREVTLLELWQTCRTCEDSCRRIGDVVVELMRLREPVSVAASVLVPPVWPIVEPDPPCIPPRCMMDSPTLAAKTEALLARATVLRDVAVAMRELDPRLSLPFYTSIRGGADGGS